MRPLRSSLAAIVPSGTTEAELTARQRLAIRRARERNIAVIRLDDPSLPELARRFVEQVHESQWGKP